MVFLSKIRGEHGTGLTGSQEGCLGEDPFFCFIETVRMTAGAMRGANRDNRSATLANLVVRRLLHDFGSLLLAGIVWLSVWRHLLGYEWNPNTKVSRCGVEKQRAQHWSCRALWFPPVVGV